MDKYKEEYEDLEIVGRGNYGKLTFYKLQIIKIQKLEENKF